MEVFGQGCLPADDVALCGCHVGFQVGKLEEVHVEKDSLPNYESRMWFCAIYYSYSLLKLGTSTVKKVAAQL